MSQLHIGCNLDKDKRPKSTFWQKLCDSNFHLLLQQRKSGGGNAASSNNHSNYDVEMSLRNTTGAGSGSANGENQDDDNMTRLFGPPLMNSTASQFYEEQHKPHPAELVDQASRGLFPMGFILMNIAYWLYYLYFTDQDLRELQKTNL